MALIPSSLALSNKATTTWDFGSAVLRSFFTSALRCMIAIETAKIPSQLAVDFRQRIYLVISSLLGDNLGSQPCGKLFITIHIQLYCDIVVPASRVDT